MVRGIAALGAVLLSSCSVEAPSTLDPRGPGASRIAGLFWFMFWVSAAVVFVVTALLLLALGRRRRGVGKDDPRWTGRLVLFGGVVIPVVVLAVLWVLTLRDMAALSAPARPTSLTIDITGYRWWWKVMYPDQAIVTANDIHIPVGRPVRLRLTTADVNHSFWVPQLMGKTDLIAGRTTSMWIQADHPGRYRGQCAEFCGLQHANMAFYVIAEAPDEFEAWADREGELAGPSAGPAGHPGLEVFLDQACVACHTIRGTEAAGTVGPDLTDFGLRISIGAGTVPNTRHNLAAWIRNSQRMKPGNLMPPIELGREDLQALVDLLESRR